MPPGDHSVVASEVKPVRSFLVLRMPRNAQAGFSFFDVPCAGTLSGCIRKNVRKQKT